MFKMGVRRGEVASYASNREPRPWGVGVVPILVVAAVVAGFVAVPTRSVDAAPAWKQAPTGLSVAPGDNAGELIISWDAHPEDPIEYRVAWAPSDENFKSFRDLDWNSFQSSTSITVTGLDAGGSYKAKVRARVSRNRNSAWSGVVTGTAGVASELRFDPTPTDKTEPVKPPESELLRGHQQGLPWAGHTVHDIQANNEGEMTTAGGQVWYRMNLQANRMYRLYSPQRSLAEVRLRVYDDQGDPHMEEGHLVHSDPERLRVPGTSRYMSAFFYFMPDAGGDYYLRVTSDAFDTGTFSLQFKGAWTSAKGNSTSHGDCDYIVGAPFSSNRCRVVPGDTSVDMRYTTNSNSLESAFANYSNRKMVYVPMEEGVTYSVCLATDERLEVMGQGFRWATGTASDVWSRDVVGWDFYVDPSGSGTASECWTFEPERTLPYAFVISNYTSGATRPGDFTFSYSEQ